jgi:general stress protein 26
MLNLRNKKQFGALAKLFEGHTADFITYLTTNTSSPKMSQISANPKVSVYFCNPGKFHGLMLGGNVEVVTDRELRKEMWQEGWKMYYPGGVDDPEYTILRLLPAFAKGWSGEGPFGFDICAKK